MKLIYAIIGNDDSETVIEELNKSGYRATKISSTGGFLKKGNTTLMICTDDEKMEDVMGIVKRVCGKRRTIEVDRPYASMMHGGMGIPTWYSDVREKIEIGGAIMFAVDVCCYEKI